MGSLILEIQEDALSKEVSTIQVLRKLYAASIKLQLTEVSEWVKQELEGYPNTQYENLPIHRQLNGDPRCNNPYHGWQPLRSRQSDDYGGFETKISRFPLIQSIAEIESIIKDHDGGQIYFNFPPKIEAQLTRAMDYSLPIALVVPVSSLHAVLEDLRGNALQIALALEAKGILGENMSFSNADKEKASSITLNVNAQNIGSISNASGFAQISNENLTYTKVDDVEKLTVFIEQLRIAASALPEAEKKEILLLAERLDQEKNDPEKAAGTLNIIKNICEGAAGNITAQGIITALTSFL